MDMKVQLDIVHNDLYTTKNLSLASARYVSTFVNDFSRYTWIYYLKDRNMVFDKFK
jgi:hypothetical protein